MRTLDRAVRNLDRGGTAIPLPFRTWSERHVSIRRGEVSMIAGPPGVGKSTLALAIAVKSGVPTLYASCDSHEATMALRAVSMLTGMAQAEVEDVMSRNPEWAAGVLREGIPHIKWMFDAAPTMSDLDDEVSVYRELQGSDPHLVIIDNAVDVTHDSGDEYSSLRSLFREVKWWARDTGAAFLILHHTSEQYTGEPAPPRSAVHGKVNQVPSLILTLGQAEGLLAVAPVKNRYGPADSSGRTCIWMEYSPSTMSLKDSTL